MCLGARSTKLNLAECTTPYRPENGDRESRGKDKIRDVIFVPESDNLQKNAKFAFVKLLSLWRMALLARPTCACCVGLTGAESGSEPGVYTLQTNAIIYDGRRACVAMELSHCR